MAMADRIAVMSEGRIEQIGTPEEIYKRPRTRFVADFIGESNFIDVQRAADGAALTATGSRLACGPGPDGWRRATLMVRPEDVRVQARNGHDQGLVGRVVRSSFLGSFTRIEVMVDGIDAPIASVMHGGTTIQFGEDATAAVTWAPQAAVLLDAEQ